MEDLEAGGGGSCHCSPVCVRSLLLTAGVWWLLRGRLGGWRVRFASLITGLYPVADIDCRSLLMTAWQTWRLEGRAWVTARACSCLLYRLWMAVFVMLLRLARVHTDVFFLMLARGVAMGLIDVQFLETTKWFRNKQENKTLGKIHNEEYKLKFLWSDGCEMVETAQWKAKGCGRNCCRCVCVCGNLLPEAVCAQPAILFERGG